MASYLTSPARSADEIRERCHIVKRRFEERDASLDAALRFYEQVGVSRRQDAEIYVVRLPDAVTVTDLIADLLASQTVTVTVPVQGDSQEAQRRANALEQFWQAWLRRVEVDDDKRLVHELAYDAVIYGALVGRIAYYPERLVEEDGRYRLGPQFPLSLEIRCWRNVYPVWRRTNIVEVYEHYTTTVIDANNDLGLDLPWRDDDTIEVYEWWDAERCAIWLEGAPYRDETYHADGVYWVRKPTPHGLGCLPYFVRFVRPQSREKSSPEKLAPSLLQRWMPIIGTMNVIESAKMTAALTYVNSAWVVKSGRADLELDLSAGAVNYLRPDEDVQPLVKGTIPVDLLRVGEDWSARFQRASVPAALYGESLGANLAGYAIALLTDSGRRIIVPIMTAIELFLADACMTVLKACHNLLAPLVGDVYIDALSSGEEAGRRILQRVRLPRVDNAIALIRVGEPLPRDKERSVNLAIGLRTPNQSGMPLLSDETIRSDILGVTDNDLELKRILRERLAANMVEVLLQDVLSETMAEQTGEDGASGMPDEATMMAIAQAMQPVAENIAAIEERLAGGVGGETSLEPSPTSPSPSPPTSPSSPIIVPPLA